MLMVDSNLQQIIMLKQWDIYIRLHHVYYCITQDVSIRKWMNIHRILEWIDWKSSVKNNMLFGEL